MKGVLEGFKKVSGAMDRIRCFLLHLHMIASSLDMLRIYLQNEEVLKKCAQDYLMRIKQEEQRYQTLKVHAEEKLDK